MRKKSPVDRHCEPPSLQPKATEVLRALYAAHPALVIADLAMPEMDGWAFLRRLRELTEIPVVILSGLGQEHDKVRGCAPAQTITWSIR